MSLHNFLLFHLRSHIKNSCFVNFIRGSKHLETIKALGLRPRSFITFSVFGTPDETLALVFDILRKDCFSQSKETAQFSYMTWGE